MPKSSRSKIELTQKELKHLFKLVILNRIILESFENSKDSVNMSLYQRLKIYFSAKTEDFLSKEVSQVLEEYINYEDAKEVDMIIEEEKETVLKVLKETEKKGINLNVEDLFNQVNQKMNETGIIRIPFSKKKQND